MSELQLELLFKRIDREYNKEDIESFKIKHGTCPFCKKWCGIFKLKMKDGSEIVYCPLCESIHKVLTFNKTYRIKTYCKGRAFEYQVKKLLEKRGYTVFRCAGSKPLDLVVFRMGRVLVCECKTTSNVSEEDKKRLGEWSVRLGFPVALFTKENGNVQIEVFECSQRKHWSSTYQLLNDFLQFLYDHYGRSFGSNDGWVQVSELDWDKVVWKFLFEGDKE